MPDAYGLPVNGSDLKARYTPPFGRETRLAASAVVRCTPTPAAKAEGIDSGQPHFFFFAIAQLQVASAY